jgi:hypothetical protein
VGDPEDITFIKPGRVLLVWDVFSVFKLCIEWDAG